MTGVGYGMVLVSGIVCIYYNLILAWALYYMAMSFTTRQLPWSDCNNDWNTEHCVQRSGVNRGLVNGTANVTANVTEGLSPLGTTIATFVREMAAAKNASGNATSVKTNTPAEEFWQWVDWFFSPKRFTLNVDIFTLYNIFTQFAFLKYPRKYVPLRNYISNCLKSQLYLKPEF